MSYRITEISSTEAGPPACQLSSDEQGQAVISLWPLKKSMRQAFTQLRLTMFPNSGNSMSNTEFKKLNRQLSASEKTRYADLAQKIEREFPPDTMPPQGKPEVVATLGDHYALRAAVAELREARERQGLSLCDLQEATGIDAAQLQCIEDGTDVNPSFAALSRYARAVGKRLSLSLSNIQEPTRAEMRR